MPFKKYAEIDEKGRIICWLSEEVHSDIPDRCIEVSQEVWQEAVDIGANRYVDGKFVREELTPSQEDLVSIVRGHRDSLLEELDLFVTPLRYETFTEEEKSQLREYRLSLLDVPQQEGFPNNVNMPTKPAFMK